ncbi:MAG: hypothetical protein Q7J98_01610 [Kiritimatiellia bacterium]|nr:hypothetical protein [Kiritimatiellia bacterium]
MKATLRKILFPVGVIWFIGLFIAGFLAYFVTSAGPNGATDGLRRTLSEAPMLMRIVFGQDRMWAGWEWFLGDMVVFWGSITVAVNISKWMED